MNETQNWRDLYFTSRDGLRLHARHYPAPGASRRPVICLPGLTRNCQDFHRLALDLGDPRGHRRDVFTVDYRGRGLSEHDKDWRNYTPLVESLDVIDLMTLAGLDDVAVIGTSRGGIIAMILAVMRPASLAAVVLNDIGPELDRAGLIRILGYVGKIPVPNTWEEATDTVRSMSRKAFPAVSDADWEVVARSWFLDLNGAPSSGYDNALAAAMSVVDLGEEMPNMWPQFEALKGLPLLALRGENSDILSRATFAAMQQRHPRLRAVTVPGQGHAPLLLDTPTIGEIADFLVDTD